MRRSTALLALITLLATGCDPKDIPEEYIQNNLQEILTQERARFDALRQELDAFQNLFRLQAVALCLVGCGLGVALYRIYRPAKGPQ